MSNADTTTEEAETNELEFLRFFYEAAGDAFGPAESDIYSLIKEDFQSTSGLELPESYREE